MSSSFCANSPVAAPKAPPKLQAFLTSKGSLTALLEAHAHQALRVVVLHEGHALLNQHQKRLLSLPVHKPQLAWIRTVKLYGNSDDAWVMATSIFPLPTLTGVLKRLRHLGRTPIGYVLFKGHRTLPHVRHYYDENSCHGRRTVYEYHGKKLLIDERFLPAFVDSLSA